MIDYSEVSRKDSEQIRSKNGTTLHDPLSPKIDWIFASPLLVLFFIYISFMVHVWGVIRGKELVYEEAKSVGLAERYIDQETGNTGWNWIIGEKNE